MKIILNRSAVLAGVFLGAFSALSADRSPAAYQGLPEWENPYITGVGKLPARSVMVPCDTVARASAIAALAAERSSSPYILALDGQWKFGWAKRPEERAADFYKPAFDVSKWATIAVPGCWQLQGRYDPALYTNSRYPHVSNPPYIMQDPPKEYTSYVYRNPVGSYRRAFTLPKGWEGRRIVLHFAGVASAMYVWVNGEKAGFSEDSRLPAEFDVTKLVKDGENTLAVEVYRWSDGSYLEDQDFWRLSGIYRSVWLVAEKKDGLRDFHVSTTLAPDFKSATLAVAADMGGAKPSFTLLDPAGHEVPLKEKAPSSFDIQHSIFNIQYSILAPALWTCETPNLYTLVINAGGDYYARRIGFRAVEIKDSVLRVNGRRILIKGTDRHEMIPETGYTITVPQMRRDIAVMKSLNVNAVRTSHYPNDPDFYTLCDEEGIYVVCEANVETHGMGYGGASLAHRPDFLKAHVERGTNMIAVLRDHPSIIGWSMGNEAGFGDNFRQEYRAMKAMDSSRPVQYERAGMNANETEIACPMYAPPQSGEHYVKNNPKKPYILCEYTHAMGNSNGGIQEYWDVVAKYPSAQGGFIWDFVDQGLWRTPQNSSAKDATLAYGGDFGDRPNDDNFCCNGFVDAFRNPHPGAYEVKHAYQNVHVDAFDWKTMTATVRNGFIFRDLKGVTGTWSLDVDGKSAAAGKLDVAALAAGEAKPFAIKAAAPTAGEAFATFRFFEDGGEIAHDQFAASAAAKTCVLAGGETAAAWKKTVDTAQTVAFAAGGDVVTFDKSTGALASWTSGGQPKIVSPVALNFWRAPIDNDRGNGMPHRLGVWREAGPKAKLARLTVAPDGGTPAVTAEYDIPAGGSKATVKYVLAGGGVKVDFHFAAAKGLPNIPRVGLTFGVPAEFTMASWYGRGPFENYDDRKTAAMVGRYQATIGLTDGVAADPSRPEIAYAPDRLNTDNYIEPGEQGYRTDVRWLRLCGPGHRRLEVCGAPTFGFNAWPYPQSALEGPKHLYEVKKGDFITVNIDAVQMGVGGDDSWGAQPHDPYQPKAGRDYDLSFRLE